MINPSAKRAATGIGFCAVLLWSLLAVLTALSGAVPPFLLAGMCFALAGAVGCVFVARRPAGFCVFRQPLPVWVLGVGGLFGYHALYFTALRNAPPVEAGLVAYLWPLLIVLFSALLPGERLRFHHIVGALLGLAGVAVIVTGGQGLTVEASYSLGYFAALLAALVWAGYSVLSRRFVGVPTEVVAGFCLVTSALSFAFHFGFEETVWPVGLVQWLAVAGLGLGPVGAAFFAWDHGVKHGDIQVMGAASYAAPLLSTLVLIGAGLGHFSLSVVLGGVAIVGGALLAGKNLLRARGTNI
ncbi:MAG: aromatic amino acid exporter YddG [Alphaproteobacteria bacterium]